MKKSPAKKAWEWFSRYYRIKHSDYRGYLTCYTCGKTDTWKSMQTGHLLDGRCHAILFEEDCVKPQCVGCNMFKSGNKEEYIPRFIDEYGRERYEELKRLKHSGKKYNKRELEEMRVEFKKMAKKEAYLKGFSHEC